MRHIGSATGSPVLIPLDRLVLLSLTRDSALVLSVAAGGSPSPRGRSVSVWMLGTAAAASASVALIFAMPMRELLAMMLNDAQPGPGASWV